jgi:hypothetical protein
VTRIGAIEIERTTFGTITIDGKTYEHDVIIRLSGDVVKRKKKLSKKYYGTSHVVSKDEALLPQCKSNGRFTSVSGHKGRRSWMMRALRILDSPLCASRYPSRLSG